MSKPITTAANLAPIPFETRLQLVSEAVAQRVQQTPTIAPCETQARLWCNWIRKNILDVPAGTEVAA
jgi:hypothetical protein